MGLMERARVGTHGDMCISDTPRASIATAELRGIREPPVRAARVRNAEAVRPDVTCVCMVLPGSNGRADGSEQDEIGNGVSPSIWCLVFFEI